jgi:hypothetical protein
MKKLLVVGVIVLFLGIIINSSSGFNQENTSSILDASITGIDLAIVEIVVYKWHEIMFGSYLCFTPKIKNIGDTPYGGLMYVNGTSRYLLTGRLHDKTRSGHTGGLEPGESWYSWSGNGIECSFPFNLPRLYRMRFTIEPIFSNPDNNYFEQVFLVWAFLRPYYISIPFVYQY